MEDKNLGALLVLNDQNKLVGMFTERDYLLKVFLHGLKSPNTPVKDIMTTNILTVGPNAKARDMMTLMTNKRFRYRLDH